MNSDRYRIRMRFQESLEKHKNRLLKTRGKNAESTYGKFISESTNKNGVISTNGRSGISINDVSPSVKKPTPLKMKIPISKSQKNVQKKIEVKGINESKIRKGTKMVSSMNHIKTTNCVKKNAAFDKETSQIKLTEDINNANIKILDNKKGSDFQKVPNDLSNNLNDLFRNFVNCKINNLYVITGERGSNGKNEINLCKEDGVQIEYKTDHLQLENLNFETNNMIVHKNPQYKQTGDNCFLNIEDTNQQSPKLCHKEKEEKEIVPTTVKPNKIKPVEAFHIHPKEKTIYEDNYKRLLKLERNMKKSIQDFEEKTKLSVKRKEVNELDFSNDSSMIPYVKDERFHKISKNEFPEKQDIPCLNHSDELTLMNSSNTSVRINVSSSSVSASAFSVFSSNGDKLTSALTGMELFTTKQHIFVEDRRGNKLKKEYLHNEREEEVEKGCDSNEDMIEKTEKAYRLNYFRKQNKEQKKKNPPNSIKSKNRHRSYEEHSPENSDGEEYITDTLTYSSCSKKGAKENSKIHKKEKKRNKNVDQVSLEAWDEENAMIHPSPIPICLRKKRRNKERTHEYTDLLPIYKKDSSSYSSEPTMDTKKYILKRKSGVNRNSTNITEGNLKKYEESQLKRNNCFSKRIKKQYEMKHHEKDLFRLIKALSEKMKKNKNICTDESTASWNYKIKNKYRRNSYLSDSNSFFSKKRNVIEEVKECSSFEEDDEEEDSSRIIRRCSNEKKKNIRNKPHSAELNKMHLYKIEECILNKDNLPGEYKNTIQDDRTGCKSKGSFIKKEIEKWKKGKLPNYLKNSHNLKNVLSNIYDDINNNDGILEKQDHVTKSKERSFLSHQYAKEHNIYRKEEKTLYNELSAEEIEVENASSNIRIEGDAHEYFENQINWERCENIEAIQEDHKSKELSKELIKTNNEKLDKEDMEMNTSLCVLSSSIVKENDEEFENEPIDMENDPGCDKDLCDLCAYPILENEPKFYLKKEKVFKDIPFDLIKTIQDKNSLKCKSNIIMEHKDLSKEMEIPPISSELIKVNYSKQMDEKAKRIMYLQCLKQNNLSIDADSPRGNITKEELDKHGIKERNLSQQKAIDSMPIEEEEEEEEEEKKKKENQIDYEEMDYPMKAPRATNASHQLSIAATSQEICKVSMKEEDAWREEWKRDMEETMKMKPDEKINNQVLKKLLKMKIETLKGELPQTNVTHRKEPIQKENILMKDSGILEALSKHGRPLNERKQPLKKNKKDKIHLLNNEINEIQKNMSTNNQISQMSMNKVIEISKNKIDELEEYNVMEPIDSDPMCNETKKELGIKLMENDENKKKETNNNSDNNNNNNVSIDYFLNSSNDFSSHKSVVESCDTIPIKNIQQFIKKENEEPLSFGINENSLNVYESEFQTNQTNQVSVYPLKVQKLKSESKEISNKKEKSLLYEKESIANGTLRNDSFECIPSNEIEVLDFNQSYYCKYVKSINSEIYPVSEEPITKKEKKKLMKAYLLDKKKKKDHSTHTLKYNVEYFKFAKLFCLGSNGYKTILNSMKSCLNNELTDEIDKVAFSIVKLFNPDNTVVRTPPSSTQVAGDQNDSLQIQMTLHPNGTLNKANENDCTCLNTHESIMSMSDNADPFKNANKPTLDEDDFPSCVREEYNATINGERKNEKLFEISKMNTNRNPKKNKKPDGITNICPKLSSKTRLRTREKKPSLLTDTKKMNQGCTRSKFDNTFNGTTNFITNKKLERTEKFGVQVSKEKSHLLKSHFKNNMSSHIHYNQVDQNWTPERSCSCKILTKNKSVHPNKNELMSYRSVSTTKPNALLKTSVLIQRYEKMKCK